ncbi:30S ribosomal protein S6 [Candidatus Parcubacteria bacterium]|nr:30S ribosomal protein S6 [Candidatus Parcubacteria bacterium]
MTDHDQEVIMDDIEAKIYEIGLLIVPTIAEEKVAGEFADIKSIIEKANGVFIAEELPKQRALAYTMVKHIGARNERFDTAYFGWVKYEIVPGAIDDIKKKLESRDTVLRFLIVKTVRENTMSFPKISMRKTEAERTPRKVSTDAAVEKKPGMSEAEIDKTIEELVTHIN